MEGIVHKLYASVTAAADGVASLDIIEPGNIVAIQAWMNVTQATGDGDGMQAEVSFASANGFGTNDTRSSIFGMSMMQNLLTSGMAPSWYSESLSGLQIPVNMGERLYLHINELGSVTSMIASIWLHFLPKPIPRRTSSTRARRRRQ